MKIRVTDIPAEGLQVDFELESESLNARSVADRENHDGREELLPPEYVFAQGAKAQVKLSLEGRTVVVSGRASAGYTTPCARCAEPASKKIDVPVNIVLKPFPTRDEDRVEDVQLGFYDGKEIDCDQVVEEFLMLSLPYTVLCSDSCRGLCQRCGANLNEKSCDCTSPEDQPPAGDERFSILRGLKVQ